MTMTMMTIGDCGGRARPLKSCSHRFRRESRLMPGWLFFITRRLNLSASYRAHALQPKPSQPLCLLFYKSLVDRFWLVTDEELLATMATSQCSHLLKAARFLATTFSYRNCSQV
jgi:hypothetical protein